MQRAGSSTEIFERYQRSEKALVAHYRDVDSGSIDSKSQAHQ